MIWKVAFAGFLPRRPKHNGMQFCEFSNLGSSADVPWRPHYLHLHLCVQFLKLSPEESAQDPIYHVLLRSSEEEKGKYSPVIAARIVFTILGCLVISSLICSIVADGSPFRTEVSTTVVEFYIIVLALSVWVGYKETSWFSASIWIVLLICLGSVATCADIAGQLYELSSEDPIYVVLLKRSKRRPARVPLLS